MIELVIKLNTSFTAEQRRACLPVVEKMTKLAEIARQSGLLVFESRMFDEESLFLKAAMSFIIEAYETETVKRILSYMILTGGFTGSDLLSRLIMAQAVIDIQCGTNPRHIREVLLSMLGEEYLQPALKSSEEGLEEVKQFLDDLSDFVDKRLISEEEKTAIENFHEVEEALRSMEDCDIQRVFHDLSDKVILYTMYYGTYATSELILHNLPTVRRLRLISQFDICERSAVVAAECLGELIAKMIYLAELGYI
jgi:hypothetical protein